MIDGDPEAWARDTEERLAKIEMAISEITKIVDALGPVVTELLLVYKEAEREKLDGPSTPITIADEEGELWAKP